MTEKELRKMIREEVEKINQADSTNQLWKIENLDRDINLIYSDVKRVQQLIDDFRTEAKRGDNISAIGYLGTIFNYMLELKSDLVRSLPKIKKELMKQKALKK